MICPRCGAQIEEGAKFCSDCGAAMDEQKERSAKKTGITVLLLVLIPIVAAVIIIILAAIAFSARRSAKTEQTVEDVSEAGHGYSMPEDIDLDSLNAQVKAIEDLELDTDIDVNIDTPEVPEVPGDIESGTEDAMVEKRAYSYTDVVINGNDITVTPNGGLNEKTVLYGDKDLKGFLDYVDDVVLEKGRKINRDFFYDLLAIMLVDKDLSPDFKANEKNIIMALAMANNFHDSDVKIDTCDLKADNASEYRYHVNYEGNENIWVVDYGKRTVFFNDGATEYTSDMFKDDYLAVWLVALEEYYGAK